MKQIEYTLGNFDLVSVQNRTVGAQLEKTVNYINNNVGV